MILKCAKQISGKSSLSTAGIGGAVKYCHAIASMQHTIRRQIQSVLIKRKSSFAGKAVSRKENGKSCSTGLPSRIAICHIGVPAAFAVNIATPSNIWVWRNKFTFLPIPAATPPGSLLPGIWLLACLSTAAPATAGSRWLHNRGLLQSCVARQAGAGQRCRQM